MAIKILFKEYSDVTIFDLLINADLTEDFIHSGREWSDYIAEKFSCCIGI